MDCPKVTLENFPNECALLQSEGLHGLVLHQDTHILDANQAASDITGYSIDELIGSKSWKLYAPESLITVQENMQTHGDVDYTVTAMSKAGEKFDVRLKVLQLEFDGEAVRLAAFKRL